MNIFIFAVFLFLSILLIFFGEKKRFFGVIGGFMMLFCGLYIINSGISIFGGVESGELVVGIVRNTYTMGIGTMLLMTGVGASIFAVLGK